MRQGSTLSYLRCHRRPWESPRGPYGNFELRRPVAESIPYIKLPVIWLVPKPGATESPMMVVLWDARSTFTPLRGREVGVRKSLASSLRLPLVQAPGRSGGHSCLAELPAPQWTLSLPDSLNAFLPAPLSFPSPSIPSCHPLLPFPILTNEEPIYFNLLVMTKGNLSVWHYY